MELGIPANLIWLQNIGGASDIWITFLNKESKMDTIDSKGLKSYSKS